MLVKAVLKKKKCVLQDSVNEFLDLSESCNGFVFETPVHWGGTSGAMTSFLDHAFYADLNGGGNNCNFCT